MSYNLATLKNSDKINIKKRSHFKKERDLPAYALILPALLLLIVFHYIPLYGIVISFQEFSPFRGVLGSEWIGLKLIGNMTSSNFLFR